MLTDIKLRKLKARATLYRVADAGGLCVEVDTSGSPRWRLRYRFNGAQKMLSLGTYPEVSLVEARQRRDATRKLLAAGVDPSAQRKLDKLTASVAAETAFETVAREWYAKHAPNWAPSHSEKIIRRLERDVFPWLGSKLVASVTAPDLLAVLHRIESRGAIETAHRAHQNCGQVFRYAIATGRATADPTPALRGSLAPWKPEHFASITEPAKVGDLLRAIDGFTGTFPVACALRLAPLVFVRPGELRQAEWADIDLDKAEWRYHVTKTDADHIVPLASQAVAILRDLHPLTGTGRFLFPGARSAQRPMSENTVNASLRRLGYDKQTMSGHGFRAMARTILDEELGFRPDFIEHQLAHAVRDPNGRAYNRTAHLVERRRMMQGWADYLDGLRTGANVVPIRKRSA